MSMNTDRFLEAAASLSQETDRLLRADVRGAQSVHWEHVGNCQPGYDGNCTCSHKLFTKQHLENYTGRLQTLERDQRYLMGKFGMCLGMFENSGFEKRHYIGRLAYSKCLGGLRFSAPGSLNPTVQACARIIFRLQHSMDLVGFNKMWNSRPEELKAWAEQFVSFSEAKAALDVHEECRHLIDQLEPMDAEDSELNKAAEAMRRQRNGSAVVPETIAFSTIAGVHSREMCADSMIDEIWECEEVRGEGWEPAENNPWRDRSTDPDWDDMVDDRDPDTVEDFLSADSNGRAGADELSESSGGDDADDIASEDASEVDESDY